jgi:hypothetical protein
LNVAVPKWEVKFRHLAELTDLDRQAWARLEARSAEPNAFMSPHFVLPALAHLDSGASPVLMWIERAAGGLKELVGVGVFRYSLGTRAFPWPHLTAYQCEHSYLGGLLVDAEAVRPVVEAIQSFLLCLERAGTAQGAHRRAACRVDLGVVEQAQPAVTDARSAGARDADAGRLRRGAAA